MKVSFVLLPSLVLLALAVPAAAEKKECEVNVNVDMTEAGLKFKPPVRERPAYYYPLVGGYREEGAVVAGERAPPRQMVIRQLAKTLAQHHYFVVGAQTPPPTILLVFHWGSMNADIDEMGEDDEGTPLNYFANQKQMLALVAGKTLGNLDLSFERDDVMQAAAEDRYFVVVSAYDFAAAQERKKVLLWRAKMSTGSLGFSGMEDVVAALIKSGGPHLGRATLRPVWVNAAARETNVEIGELRVQEYFTPAQGQDGREKR